MIKGDRSRYNRKKYLGIIFRNLTFSNILNQILKCNKKYKNSIKVYNCKF